jgi:hypothetical protein
MTTNMTTIRPGILVAFRTAIAGGVEYRRVDLDAPPDAGEVAADPNAPAPAVEIKKEVTRWETTKILTDAEEHKLATQIRNSAVRDVRKVCSETTFGLLCPQAQETALDEAFATARAKVDTFNAGARFTRIQINMLKGRIASTDEEAVKAITAEVGAMVRQIDRAVKSLEPEAIRAAAKRAAEIGAILGDDDKARLSEAIKAARTAATQIARADKLGQKASFVLATEQQEAIDRARWAFLDLDDAPAEEAGEALPAADLARTAGLDLDDAPEERAAPEESGIAPVVETRGIDLDDAPAAEVTPAAPMLAALDIEPDAPPPAPAEAWIDWDAVG